MKTPTVAVLLNGPPGIGKDTLADRIAEVTKIKKMEYKEGLRIATAKYFGVEQAVADMLFADRGKKEIKNIAFDGLTPREALIHVNSHLIKEHGVSMVGVWAAEKVQKYVEEGEKAFIFSDSGFQPEAEMVAEKVDILIIVQLWHPDYNFDNDSRDYINVDLHNSETIKFRRQDEEINSDASRLIGLITDILWERRFK